MLRLNEETFVQPFCLMFSIHKGVANGAALFGRMTRDELPLTIQSRKRAKRLTWKQIATAIGTASPIVTTAALFGQVRLDDDEAAKAAELLELDDEERLF